MAQTAVSSTILINNLILNHFMSKPRVVTGTDCYTDMRKLMLHTPDLKAIKVLCQAVFFEPSDCTG
jgi:hypothetical protein